MNTDDWYRPQHPDDIVKALNKRTREFRKFIEDEKLDTQTHVDNEPTLDAIPDFLDIGKPSSFEWQAARILVLCGYHDHKTFYVDQGGNYRLTPHSQWSMNVDDTEHVELTSATGNSLLQLEAIETYLRDANNLFYDLWKESASVVSMPGNKSSNFEEVNLVTMHSYRMRTVIQCLRVLGEEQAEAEATKMPEDEVFNLFCRELMKKYVQGISLPSKTEYTPYQDFGQLGAVVETVIKSSGVGFNVSSWADVSLTDTMRDYVNTYGTDEYMQQVVQHDNFGFDCDSLWRPEGPVDIFGNAFDKFKT